MVRRSLFLFVAALIVILDQATKYYIVRAVAEGSQVAVISGFFYITRITNTGAAFSMFQHSPLLLAGTALLVVAGLGIYVAKAKWPMPATLALGLALPLGGAVGNLIDRVRLGYVVDFIELRFGSYIYPIFNVADSAICIGVALLVLAALRTPSTATSHTEETKSVTL